MAKQNIICLAIGVLWSEIAEFVCVIGGLLFVYNSFSILHFLMEDEYHAI